VLDVEPESVGPLLSLAEAKLAGLMKPRGGQAARSGKGKRKEDQ
jgi:hypothetical protein